MAEWKCSECGHTREARCKPRKCPECASSKGFVKAEDASESCD